MYLRHLILTITKIKQHALLLFVGLIISNSYGDGVFVWNKGADLHEPSQKAIIHLDSSKETLILQVKYEGPAQDFAWIVPLPSEPKVTAIEADKDPFAELSLYTQQRNRLGMRSESVNLEDDVTILQRNIVGVYDIAVLASGNAIALNSWLNNNGFYFPEDKSDILEHYTRKKWVYVAMKIEPGALENDNIEKLKTGELQAICFTFPSDEMVYPLKISSANAGETELLLYLLAEAPMVLENKNQPEGFSIEQNLVRHHSAHTIEGTDLRYGTYYKVNQEQLPLTWEALALPEKQSLSLCKYKVIYTPDRMTEDLMFSAFSPLDYWRKYFSFEINEDYNAEIKRRLACMVFSSYDTALIKKLAGDLNPKNRQLAAIHPKASDELLIELAQDNNNMVKNYLVENKRLPAKALDILARTDDSHLRAWVARHPSTPLKNLNDLADDESSGVRHSVISNPKTTLEILEKFLDDPDPTIRSSLAHKDIPTDWLLKLSKDKDPYVRASVAQQSNLPKTILEELSKDTSEEVRRAIELFQKSNNEDK